MRTRMIVNRMHDWFQIEDVELNICSLSLNILQRLYTRPRQGFEYDRVNLAYEILHRKSAEAVEAIDKGICVLVSRNLIYFEEKKQGRKKILITEVGKNAVQEYEGLIRDET